MPFVRRSALPALVLGFVACAVFALASARAGDLLQQHIGSIFDAPFAAATDGGMSSELDDGRSRVVRWRSEFLAFAAQDRVQPPVAGSVVFVGSSSIRLWNGLERAFPSIPVVNRGFGGSELADCARHVDRLVLPHRPAVVVVYAGENDLAAGRSTDSVVSSYVSFVRQVHDALPQTRVVFVSVKPSPAREAQTGQARQVNERIAALSRDDSRLGYVDVFTPMLDSDGRPRADLFRSDGLHLNATGYALWRAAVAVQVDRASERLAVGAAP